MMLSHRAAMTSREQVLAALEDIIDADAYQRIRSQSMTSQIRSLRELCDSIACGDSHHKIQNAITHLTLIQR
jgi:hypothetical protein